MARFQLPGRTLVSARKARVLHAYGASYRWNPRNLEAPWYPAWQRQLEDLTADLANISLAPQNSLWYVKEEDTGVAANHGRYQGAADRRPGVADESENSGNSEEEDGENSDISQPARAGSGVEAEGDAVVLEEGTIGVRVDDAALRAETIGREESPDPLDFLRPLPRNNTDGQSHDSRLDDRVDNGNGGNEGNGEQGGEGGNPGGLVGDGGNGGQGGGGADGRLRGRLRGGTDGGDDGSDGDDEDSGSDVDDEGEEANDAPGDEANDVPGDEANDMPGDEANDAAPSDGGSSNDHHTIATTSSIESNLTTAFKHARTRIPDFVLLHFLAKNLSPDNAHSHRLGGIRVTHGCCVLIAEIKKSPSRRAEGTEFDELMMNSLSSARFGLSEQCSFAFQRYPKMRSVIGIIAAGPYWSHAIITPNDVDDLSSTYSPSPSAAASDGSGISHEDSVELELEHLDWAPTTKLDTAESNEQMERILELLQTKRPLHSSIL